MSLVSLLEDLLLKHPHLKAEDRYVVSAICAHLSIPDDERLVVINKHYRFQAQAESAAVYLKGKYDKLKSRWEAKLEEQRIGEGFKLGSKDDEGLKWTKGGKVEWLLATDAKFQQLHEYMQIAESLCELLRELSTLVFRIDRRLEQLSNNYRIEVKADRR